MEKFQSTEVQDIFIWELRGYEEYIAGYKLYKQLKKKWDAIEKEETTEAIERVL